MPRALVAAGLLLALAGLLMMAGVPLGRLPGDIVFRTGNATVYLPLATCVLASIALTVVMLILSR